MAFTTRQLVCLSHCEGEGASDRRLWQRSWFVWARSTSVVGANSSVIWNFPGAPNVVEAFSPPPRDVCSKAHQRTQITSSIAPSSSHWRGLVYLHASVTWLNQGPSNTSRVRLEAPAVKDSILGLGRYKGKVGGIDRAEAHTIITPTYFTKSPTRRTTYRRLPNCGYTQNYTRPNWGSLYVHETFRTEWAVGR